MSTARTAPVSGDTAGLIAQKLDAFVFPLGRDKHPLTRGSWREASTNDAAEIKRLWIMVGGAAYVGVDCGKSALLVVDVDDPEAVPLALLRILEANPTLTMRSLNRGQPHYYYRAVLAGRTIPGGDIKGVGGYVLASPDHELEDREIAEIPVALIDLFELKPPRDPAPTTTGTRPEPAYPEGDELADARTVSGFFDTYAGAELDPETQEAFLEALAQKLIDKVALGEHRRQATRDMVFSASLEAAAGFYEAEAAYNKLEATYRWLRNEDPEERKHYTEQRRRDYEAMWAGAAEKIAEGVYTDKVFEMRSEKGLIEIYTPPISKPPEAPSGELTPKTPGSKPDEFTHPDLKTSPPPTPPPVPPPSKAETATHRESIDTAFDKPEPEPAPLLPGPDVGRWIEDGIEIPLDRRLYRSADLFGATPRMKAAIFNGKIGEILGVLDGATEAPLATIAANLIPMLGIMLGRQTRFQHGDLDFTPNMFWVVVAPTGLGRKGTGTRASKKAIDFIDPSFFEENCIDGLASGEFLINAMSDPVYLKTGDLKSGREDQRAVLHYEEFSGLLLAINREGSMFSSVLRRAYDQSAALRYGSMTHGAKISSKHHIGISAAITPNELQTHFSKLSTSDGLGNRITWAWTDTERMLPEGGHIDVARLAELSFEIRDGMGIAHPGDYGTVVVPPKVYRFSEEVRERWVDFDYEVLHHKGRSESGLGVMLARQSNHVLKTALIYAAIDGADSIEMSHYEAGLAWADYSEATVTALFAGTTHTQIANECLASIREHPGRAVSRSELYKAFGFHKTSAQLAAALDELERQRMIYRWKGESEGRGPKPEFVIATVPR